MASCFAEWHGIRVPPKGDTGFVTRSFSVPLGRPLRGEQIPDSIA